MKKAVIFDCDGVLLNTEEVGIRALHKLFNELGLKYDAVERFETLTGRDRDTYIRTLSEKFREAHGRDLPFRKKAAGLVRYALLMRREMAVHDGVFDLLDTLKNDSVPIAMASNTRSKSLNKKLKKMGLFDYFDPNIVSKNDVENSKPAPDAYLKAMDDLGVTASQCIIVEDSLTGVTAAHASGAYVIGYTTDTEIPDQPRRLINAGANETVNSMAELKQRLTALLACQPQGPSPAP